MSVDSPPAPEPSSVLLYGGTALCCDDRGSVFRQGEILVQRGVIASLGKSLTLMPGTKLIDITSHLVIPGFIEAHTGLGTWSIGAENRVEAARLAAAHDDQSAHALGLEAAVEALVAGVTTVHDDGVVAGLGGLQRALGESGLRVAAGGALTKPRERRPLGLASLRDSEFQPPSDSESPRGASSAMGRVRRATQGAAKNLGVGADLGSLEVGKWADLVVLGCDPARLASASQEELYEMVLDSETEIRQVLVAGTALIRDGAPVHHDLASVKAEAETQRAMLKARAG